MKDHPKRQGDQVEALSMSQERNLKQRSDQANPGAHPLGSAARKVCVSHLMIHMPESAGKCR